MPRMSAAEAGRLGGLKGGKSRSDKKLAACRRNGFQPTKPTATPVPAAEPGRPGPLLFIPKPEANRG